MYRLSNFLIVSQIKIDYISDTDLIWIKSERGLQIKSFNDDKTVQREKQVYHKFDEFSNVSVLWTERFLPMAFVSTLHGFYLRTSIR